MDDAELRRQIVGTWTLVSVVYEDVATGDRTPVYGEHPRGIQIATPEGRWLALMTAEGRAIPKTDADRAQALKSMIAYTGPLSRRRRPGHHQSRSGVERSLGRRRAGAQYQVRERPALHREPADAAPEHQRQDGAGDRGVGAGEELEPSRVIARHR